MVRKKREALEQVLELVERLLDMYQQGYGRKGRIILSYLIEQGGVVPEEIIGRKLGLKSNEARKILQILAEQGIISFRRVASRERSRQGWYIDTDNLESIIINRLKRALEKLKTRLEYEMQTNIYYCPHDFYKATIDEAFDIGFTCPRCGSILEEYGGERSASFLREKIKEIESLLKDIGAL